MQKVFNSKIYFYNGSSITFRDGIVESYSNNNGNLKIKLVRSDDSKRILGPDQHGDRPTKYIYFTFTDTEIGVDSDPITGKIKLREPEYSKIFSINEYTYQKEQDLEFCLTERFKEWTGKKAIVIGHSYSDKQSALSKWNGENGRLFNYENCEEQLRYRMQ